MKTKQKTSVSDMKIIYTILIILGMIMIYKLNEPRLKEHNKYQCAVIGYYEDCETPLPEELRLK